MGTYAGVVVASLPPAFNICCISSQDQSDISTKMYDNLKQTNEQTADCLQTFPDEQPNTTHAKRTDIDEECGNFAVVSVGLI